MSDLGGVWRTVGGRRIFIKDGQDLASAMKESGKFLSKEEKAEKSVLIRRERDKIAKKLRRKGLSEEDYKKLKEEKDRLTEEKSKLDKDLTEEDLKNARHRIEQRENESKLPKINIENEEKSFNNLMNSELKNIKEELNFSLKDIERYENDYGIDAQTIDETITKTMEKIDNMHENGEITDYVYEKYLDTINQERSSIMSEKGYEFYDHHGETYYSMIPKAKKSYDDILNELDKRGVKYKISNSWNPGELPSIYVEDEYGNQFRIANHFNNKNQQFSSNSLKENKIYSTKDYINYKETVLKDLDDFLNEK